MTSVTGEPDPPTSRRERLRAELVDEIKTAARQQMAEGGPAAVTWRGIARAVGMSPAALYTYFDSLDDLFTALIVDSFHSQAAAVRAAMQAVADRSVCDRLFAGVLAYRSWAMSNPSQFRLIYDEQIPGYTAPEEGPTVAASLSVSAQFLTLLAQGWREGSFPPAPPGPPVDPSRLEEHFGIQVSPDELRSAVGMWALFHGLTQLEVNGHLSPGWIDTEALYEAEFRASIERMGLPRPSDDIAVLVEATLGRAPA